MKKFFCSFNVSQEQQERLVAGKGMNDLNGYWTFNTLVMIGSVIKIGQENIKSLLQHERYHGDTRRVLHSLVKERIMQ
jgi:hypothetical protein